MSGALKKHLLQLDGLGVRELAIRGRDLYILAGPTMDLDRPVSLYLWPRALDAVAESLLSKADLRKILDVPYGTGEDAGRDHAEGIAIVEGRPTDRLLVCYDSPARRRLVDGHPEQVKLDAFALDPTTVGI